MKIEIDSKWYIDVDDYQYTIVEVKKSESKGVPYTITHGHYRDLDTSLDNLAKIITNNKAEKMNLSEYIEELKTQRKLLTDAVNSK